ncbi:hypothetical protein NOVO_09305 (plasmid) [Rickettsiales bacterium Ac37b]|nr:hypothetical protein NOVO_09305 [Rickettsiales bacterium Ac37b]
MWLKAKQIFIEKKQVFRNFIEKTLHYRLVRKYKHYSFKEAIKEYQKALTSFYTLLFLLISVIIVIYEGLHVYEYNRRNVKLIKNTLEQDINSIDKLLLQLGNKFEIKNKKIEELLKAENYNGLLSSNFNNISIEGIYIVLADYDFVSYSEYGKMKQNLYVPDEFYNLLGKKFRIPKYKVLNNKLFAGLSIPSPSLGVSYIILLIDLPSLVQSMQRYINIDNEVIILDNNGNINASTSQKSLTTLNNGLMFFYSKLGFLSYIKDNILVILIRLFLSFICVFSIYFINLIFLYKLKFIKENKNEDQEHYISLKQAFHKISSFYNDIIGHINSPFLGISKEYNPNVSEMSLSTILQECESIIYMELYAAKVELKIMIKEHFTISGDKIIFLKLLLINCLQRSLRYIPNKGYINISVSQYDCNKVEIKIIDNAYHLSNSKEFWIQDFNMFSLTDNALHKLALSADTLLVFKKLDNNQGNITIIRYDNNISNIGNSNNVILFPSKN